MWNTGAILTTVMHNNA